MEDDAYFVSFRLLVSWRSCGIIGLTRVFISVIPCLFGNRADDDYNNEPPTAWDGEQASSGKESEVGLSHFCFKGLKASRLTCVAYD